MSTTKQCQTWSEIVEYCTRQFKSINHRIVVEQSVTSQGVASAFRLGAWMWAPQTLLRSLGDGSPSAGSGFLTPPWPSEASAAAASPAAPPGPDAPERRKTRSAVGPGGSEFEPKNGVV